MDEDFSEEFLSEMEALLRSERKTLVRRQQTTSQEILDVQAADDGVHDTLDTTTMEQVASTMLVLKDRELTRLIEINDALRRLELGEYGYCEQTGEAIPLARLRYNPAARLTVEAQQEVEEDERRRKFRPGLMDDME